MLNIESWLPLWSRAVLERFGGRVLFLGLQGSRARGEAREDSDIDTVLVLDRLEASDLAALREALAPCRSGESSAASSPGGRSCWPGSRGSCFSFTTTRAPSWAASISCCRS